MLYFPAIIIFLLKPNMKFFKDIFGKATPCKKIKKPEPFKPIVEIEEINNKHEDKKKKNKKNKGK